MKLSVSDLAYAGFRFHDFCKLDKAYGLEFFYEFGTPAYWDAVLPQMTDQRHNGISVHGPCVQVNLAAPDETHYLNVFLDTFRYAAKIQAEFVVIHTNEALPQEETLETLRLRVWRKLSTLLKISEEAGIPLVIENVGLRPYNNVLFDWEHFSALKEIFPEAFFLLDTGHAHVNGWNLTEVLREFGPRLLGCHVHDNDGQGDQHLPVGSGIISWPGFFSGVKKFAPQARLVLEYASLPTEGMNLHLAGLCKRYTL